MRRLGFGGVALAIAVGLAAGSTNLSEQAQNTLSPIDSIPSRAQLDKAFDNDPVLALANLSTIAADDMADTGFRLRAIHALAKYCDTTPCTASDTAHAPLVALVSQNVSFSQISGSPVLVLRAAIETLGPMGVSTDVDLLIPLLEHPVRDIRAATARALRDLCNSQAITPLRVQKAKETTEQVKLAISEALRALEQCSGI